MTRIELMDTIRRCGIEVQGTHDGKLRIKGYEPNPMTESQALQVVERLSSTHCLECGRPFRVNGSSR